MTPNAREREPFSFRSAPSSLLLFSTTLFVSAFLLFQIQPLVGKTLLPVAGGTPSVWNSCMVFFQIMLLLGYLWAHIGSSRLGHRLHCGLHLLILLSVIALLPVTLPEKPLYPEIPALGILLMLLLSVGLPFFVVSATAPLLQKWFARSGHPNPYFLYAASNAGSLLGLLAYPLLIEPRYSLREQADFWAVGYLALLILIPLCAWLAVPQHKEALPEVIASDRPNPTAGSPKRWILLAFIPSSLLLSVTTHISTDIAPIPLLWVVPLSLYLLSFILVFSRRRILPHEWMSRLLPPAVLILSLILLSGATELNGVPVVVLLGVHLLVFFLAAMVSHGELAELRPEPSRLTEFYLWMSFGGMLGGLFNSLLAPVLFRSFGLVEYPLVLLLAVLVCPPFARFHPANKPAPVSNLGLLWPMVPALVTVLMLILVQGLHIESWPIRIGLLFGLPVLLAYPLVDHPPRLVLTLALLMFVGAFAGSGGEELLFRERNYFGVVKVVEVRTETGTFHRMIHGNTIHGQQRMDSTDSEGRYLPLTYYHPTGPIGEIFRRQLHSTTRPLRVEAIGLGTGSLAWYARAGDSWTFREIDPTVIRIAEDPAYFGFLSQCRATSLKMIPGDARLTLRDAAEEYDVLVLDAFSSDSIPVHLLTREAMQLYLKGLSKRGIIAFHISNRYLDLKPVLANLATVSEPPLTALVREDQNPTDEQKREGKQPSIWVVMARHEEDLAILSKPNNILWPKLTPNPAVPMWQDSFSSLRSVFRWSSEE